MHGSFASCVHQSEKQTSRQLRCHQLDRLRPHDEMAAAARPAAGPSTSKEDLSDVYSDLNQDEEVSLTFDF